MRTIILAALLLTLFVFFYVPVDRDMSTAELLRSGDSYQSSFARVQEGKLPVTSSAIQKNEILKAPPVENQVASGVSRVKIKDKHPAPESVATLTAHGVLEWTNYYRERHGLGPLRYNSSLAMAAQLKVKDMFEEQYFEHTSPDGVRFTEFDERAGYEYILVGENIALGNFVSSKDLVDAWMASPGHRANILNKNYTEIGIGLRYGLFKGNRVWLASQEFGMPSSACPMPDDTLREKIDDGRTNVRDALKRLEAMEQSLRELRSKDIGRYNEEVREYNSFLEKVRIIRKELNRLIDHYNTQLSVYNECVPKEKE